MMHHADGGGRITGTKDENDDPIWFAEQCLSNALRLETYRADAEKVGDTELADLFGKAQSDSTKGAELAEGLLARRLGAR
ncbi:hypothetical protein ACH0CV_08335 [Brachybacterium paraconglomeratum]|uniref:hypothetical protein n=1 Tax=Brachybacterium paraconglomeratum TaxID=173362 RepID=UPI0021A7AAB7|nr:hypothetical protein [Brachybacterium paraconglomeratum]MCT1910034.1 hypothetical protein [Brachybacterium paraconglomeratum]